MVDDLHHLVRMERHDDIEWTFGEGEVILLRLRMPVIAALERFEQLCQRLGFSRLTDATWAVETTNPHYEDLWVFVEQDRLDSGQV